MDLTVLKILETETFKLILVLSFLLIEIIFFLKLNLKYCLNPPNFRKEGSGEGIKNYSFKALSWLAILIALITLVDIKTFKASLFLFMSLIFFILSFIVEIISGRKRIFYFIQHRLFNYAILFLFICFLYFVSDKALVIKVIIYLTGVILVCLHIYEFVGDNKVAKNTET